MSASAEPRPLPDRNLHGAGAFALGTACLVANDTIVKMLWFLGHAEGHPEKRKILTRVNGYHGVTVAASSMTGKPYNAHFGLPLDGFLHLTCPHHWREGAAGESEAAFTMRLAAELDEVSWSSR